MNKLKWYFPETLDESHFLKTKNKSAFHSGGTGLRRVGLNNIDTVIDMSKLPIKYFRNENEIKIGGGLTFSETVSYFNKNNINSILTHSLSSAANTPLRNRITIGGSLGAMHTWSDLIGPLLVLDSKVVLYKGYFETVEIERFLSKKEFRENAIIESVEIPNENSTFYYHRETRTKVDYPAFTISIVKTSNKIKIALTGSKKRFLRLRNLEDAINLNKFKEEIVDNLGISFQDKPHGSSSYLFHCFKTELLRGLRSIGYDW